MLSLWPVYLLIALILLVDILLLIGIVSAVIALVISFMLGYSLQIVEQKIEEYLRDLLHGSRAGKVLFPVLHVVFGFIQLSKGMPAVLAAIVYILLSSIALLALNIVLAWLIYSYHL